MNLIMLDIDGTLTQSYEFDLKIFGIAIAEVLGCLELNVDLEDYIDTTSAGVTREAIQRITGRTPRKEEIEEVQRRVLWHLDRLHRESPEVFVEVPGASRFLEQVRKIKEIGIAIATGCWRSEALFKLGASGLKVGGIPLTTSDDDPNRMRIMEIAVEVAREFYGCQRFDRVVSLGDGPWDLQACLSLGFDFVGIGPRMKAVKESVSYPWHPDYLKLDAVLSSIGLQASAEEYS